MSDPAPRRKLAAILAADAVNFSLMMGKNEDRTLKNLKVCRAITDESIQNNHGRIFHTAGDSVIAEFASPVDAVVAAVEFQKILKERNLTCDPEDVMQFRVGLNLGDIIIEGDNLYGEGINIAARIEATAEAGGISVSHKFYEEVNRKLDLNFESMGEQSLKNISQMVVTYRVNLGQSSPVNQSAAVVAAHQPIDLSVISDAKPPSIAVLPFTNMSGDPEQEYFADGITEDIITNLSTWKTFPVISRNSSFTYKGKVVNMKELGKELGVSFAVEGSIRKSGNRVRITAQLINTIDDQHLWSEKWDRNLDDIFEVQDEISIAIAAKVSPAITGKLQEQLNKKPPANMNAWELYLKGLSEYNNRQKTDGQDAGLDKAKEFLEKSVEVDPSYADAYSLLAQCHTAELIQNISKDGKQTLQNMFDLAKKAESLDQVNLKALSVLGMYYFFKAEYALHAEYFQKLLKSNPSAPGGHTGLGVNKIVTGDFFDSLELMKKGIELSPFDPEIHHMYAGIGLANMGLKNYQESLNAIDTCLSKIKAGNFIGYKTAALAYLDRMDEAGEYLNMYLSMRPAMKTEKDFRRLMWGHSEITTILFEGLLKAGWKPEA